MIHEVLPVIANEVNDYFKIKFSTTEAKVILSSILDQNGAMAVKSDNVVLMSLIQVEADSTRGGLGGATNVNNIPININLYVIFAAHFQPENYEEALKFLSGVIGFFQSKRTFSPINTPSLPADAAEKISVEMVKLSYYEMSNIWGMIGAKYMPSVIYKFRSLSISDDRIRNVIPVISGV